MIVLFFVFLYLVNAHQVQQDPISEVDPRRAGEKEWTYEGIPIEVPRRYALGGDQNTLGDLDNSKTAKEVDPRRAGEKEWTYEGIPIEVPRRYALGGDQNTLGDLVNRKTAKGTRRIYNADEESSVEEHPYMAAILVNNELWCGGAIIAGDKILTAAHCLQLQYNNRFFREYVRMLAVRVGSSNATDGGQLLKVSEIYFHPNYVPQTLQFNLAVLMLNKNLTFFDHTIRPIGYSDSNYIDGNDNITFLGWGAVDELGDRGGRQLLQKVQLPIYNNRDCQDIYGKELVTRHNFCAGYITVLKNVCNHDAGGPAILDNKLVGILSFSHSRCDVLDKPAVFSFIQPDWLDNLEKKSKTGYNIAG